MTEQHPTPEPAPAVDPDASFYVLHWSEANERGLVHAWPRALRHAAHLWFIVQDDQPIAWAPTQAEIRRTLRTMAEDDR